MFLLLRQTPSGICVSILGNTLSSWVMKWNSSTSSKKGEESHLFQVQSENMKYICFLPFFGESEGLFARCLTMSCDRSQLATVIWFGQITELFVSHDSGYMFLSCTQQTELACSLACCQCKETFYRWRLNSKLCFFFFFAYEMNKQINNGGVIVRKILFMSAKFN